MTAAHNDAYACPFTVDQLLETAVDVLVRGGWRQHGTGSPVDPDDRHCALGAVYCAAHVLSDGSLYRTIGRYAGVWNDQCSYARPAWDAITWAWDRLQKQAPGPSIVRFNDAPDTTAEDVLLVFKRAAHSM